MPSYICLRFWVSKDEGYYHIFKEMKTAKCVAATFKFQLTLGSGVSYTTRQCP